MLLTITDQRNSPTHHERNTQQKRPGLERVRAFSVDGWLEVVLDGELHLTRVGPDRIALIEDVAELLVEDVVLRIAEKRAVEQVVGIRAEVDLVLVPDGDVLGDRSSKRLEARRTFGVGRSSTKGSERGLTVGANAVVNARRGARNCGWVRTEPVVDGAIDNLQWTIVIRALRVAVNSRVII